MTEKGAISCVETDIEVDFAPPLGYIEPTRQIMVPSAGSAGSPGLPAHTIIHTQGSMSEAIGYAQLVPSTRSKPTTLEEKFSRIGPGQRLAGKKGSRVPTPTNKPTTPIAGQSSNPPPLTSNAPSTIRRPDGPQPLRLPPGKLFFGYELMPLRKRDDKGVIISEEKNLFTSAGVKLNGTAIKGDESSDKKGKGKEKEGAQLKGTGAVGVKLGDAKGSRKREVVEID